MKRSQGRKGLSIPGAKRILLWLEFARSGKNGAN